MKLANVNFWIAAAVLVWAGSTETVAQVPQSINFQGRLKVGAADFNGTGQFKFALVNNGGSETFWSNDGTSTGGNPPTAAVSLNVANGLYAVLLGDVGLPNMTPVPAAVFHHPDVRLRVWFNDGANGFQQLIPDQRVGSVGYAMVAGNVPDRSITQAKLAPASVANEQLADGAISPSKIQSTAGFRVDTNGTIYAEGFVSLANGGAIQVGGKVSEAFRLTIDGIDTSKVTSVEGLGASQAVRESTDVNGERRLELAPSPPFEIKIQALLASGRSSGMKEWYLDVLNGRGSAKNMTFKAISSRDGTTILRTYNLINCWPVSYRLAYGGGQLEQTFPEILTIRCGRLQ